MKYHVIPVLAALGLTIWVPAQAQTPRPSLDYESAAAIRDACMEWASSRGLKIAVAIMDTHGMLITYAHMDEVKPVAGEVAQWKASSSAKFGLATDALGKLSPPANMPGVATIRGGIPIYTKDGKLLGGVGTSGAKSEEDAACGTAGAEAAGLATSVQ